MLTHDQKLHAMQGVLCKTTKPYRVFADSTAVWVYAMLYGNARLCIGTLEDNFGFERGFCYETLEKAFAAVDAWDGTGEPAGWHRCLQTGRRRSAGDASQEYVLK